MANKEKRGNKTILIGSICAVAALVVIAVVAILLLNKGNLNDSYFVSDDTKYVVTIDSDSQGDPAEPIKTHYVYTYSGESITGGKIYAVYNTSGDAKAAFEVVKASVPEEASKYELKDKYIIMNIDKEDYESLTVSDVKQQIEFLEMVKNMMNEEDDSTEVEATDGDGLDEGEIIEGEAETVEE